MEIVTVSPHPRWGFQVHKALHESYVIPPYYYSCADNKPQTYERAGETACGGVEGARLPFEVRIRPVCDRSRPGRPLEREDDRGHFRVPPADPRGKDCPARAPDARGMRGWPSRLSSRNSPRKRSGSWTRRSARELLESSGRLRPIPLDT